MKMPIAEIIDRYTIVSLKFEKIGPQFVEEYKAYKKEIDDMDKTFLVRGWISNLLRINRRIWDLEAQLRQGEDEALGLEEIGRRAIAIRNKNRERVAIKNEISSSTGTGFVDGKMDHVSEQRDS